jgi:hypothetical protein
MKNIYPVSENVPPADYCGLSKTNDLHFSEYELAGYENNGTGARNEWFLAYPQVRNIPKRGSFVVRYGELNKVYTYAFPKLRAMNQIPTRIRNPAPI